MEHCEVPRWKNFKNQLSNLDYDQFMDELHNKEDLICIDARTPEEFNGWHIDGAININYLSQNLADQLEELEKSSTYYVYCRTSRRSLRICILLKNMGFEHVFHLRDGIKDYLK